MNKGAFDIELARPFLEALESDPYRVIMNIIGHHSLERATMAHILHNLYGWTAEQAVAHIEALDAKHGVSQASLRGVSA